MKKLVVILFFVAVCIIVPIVIFINNTKDKYFEDARFYNFYSAKLISPTLSEKNEILNGVSEEVFINNFFNNQIRGSIYKFYEDGSSEFVNANGLTYSNNYKLLEKDSIRCSFPASLLSEGSDLSLATQAKLDGNKMILKFKNFESVGSGTSYIEVVYVF